MFVLAETLGGCTVDELSHRMSLSERAEWKAYFDYKDRQRQREQQRQKAQKSNSRTRSTRPHRRR